ncbi:hypothetical protein DKX38_013808 [Salix brachista]|uniref:Uncharacterized protein n=1 Tax=Salix brachista TaxID=2182728 RepID=A0A5N5LDK3_9ROSI|nr:hypothetical protein DKX38_013808 [Salix brachista]
MQLSLSSPFALATLRYSQAAILIILVLFCSFLLLLLFLQWHRPRDKRLPPGSMGWPYVGETLKLYTENPNSFFSNRQKRFGDIFKTHILGCPCVMISSPEAARTVLVTRAHLFKPTYPTSKEKMIGPEALFFHQGSYHSRLKKLVQASLLPSAIRGSVSQIEQIVLELLPTWKSNTINTLQEMKRVCMYVCMYVYMSKNVLFFSFFSFLPHFQYAFDVAMISAFGSKQDLEMEGLKHLYRCLEKGYNSMPLDFPGTPFHKAMKARKLLDEKLRKLIQKRRQSGRHEGGLLGILLGAKDHVKLNQLSDSQIADNIIGVTFAAQDTTASVLTWILKYLHDNQDLLEAVTREQEGIRSKIVEANRGLTWEDTRRMPLTSRVIQETLRTASILSFTFREAVQDVEFEGYLIPKGWKVLPLFRSIHHCADFFPQPEKFDPSRFEVRARMINSLTYVHLATYQKHTYAHVCRFLRDLTRTCPLAMECTPVQALTFLLSINFTDKAVSVLELSKYTPLAWGPANSTCICVSGDFVLKWEIKGVPRRWQTVGDEDGIQYGPFPVPKLGLPLRVNCRNKSAIF